MGKTVKMPKEVYVQVIEDLKSIESKLQALKGELKKVKT